jgi:hypothetical protein
MGAGSTGLAAATGTSCATGGPFRKKAKYETAETQARMTRRVGIPEDERCLDVACMVPLSL